MGLMRTSELTQEIVRELLDYDPRTGVFVWKWRAREWFDTYRSHCSWNARWADKQAFANKRAYPTNTYMHSFVNSEPHTAHQTAFMWMLGRWPTEVDHKNGDGTDNRWSNLREVTRTENQQNRRPNRGYAGKPPQFKHMGIKRNNKGYGARITVNGKPLWLGTYATVEEAVTVRRQAQEKYGFSERHGR